MTKRALISIDYTNDFVASTGALTCGEPAQKIESTIYDITQAFINKKELVVFAIDCHHFNDTFHPESNLYPPHNIEGTIGRQLYGSIQQLYEENKHSSHVIFMDKTRYSAFCGTDLELLLRERKIEEIHLIGVCTDICVLHTAVDAYNKGFKVIVHRNAVASFNTAGHEWALQHFENVLGNTVK